MEDYPDLVEDVADDVADHVDVHLRHDVAIRSQPPPFGRSRAATALDLAAASCAGFAVLDCQGKPHNCSCGSRDDLSRSPSGVVLESIVPPSLSRMDTDISYTYR